MIDGLFYSATADETSAICVVQNLTDSLKNEVRSNLAKICHGAKKVNRNPKIYSYKNTIKEFMDRYNSKADLMQTGMLGELLCHTLLFKCHPNLKAASPYFNMEEANIKKGFDLIISNSDNNALCLAEVKSGELGKLNLKEKTRALIDLAKNDLITRISSSACPTLWYSAVNNVELSFNASNAEQKLLVDKIEEFLADDLDLKAQMNKVHVFLVPVLFETVANQIDLTFLSEKFNSIIAAMPFSGCTIFAIQKSTLTKLESFLRDEAGNHE
ncbi:hypothetical protein [Pseudoduganella rhizocola]|uniref:hypothetical protein n=1 Tax=Pseudoduganella rhizocola TaxID=3382643 RepID=UPI0038B66EBD